MNEPSASNSLSIKQKQTIGLLMIILFVIGIGIGILLAGKPTTIVNNYSNNQGQQHDDSTLEPIDGTPSVNLVLHEDPVSGWNAQLITENFSFAPEKAGSAFVENEGHAHIYVDGVKNSRVYSEWFYLGVLEPGEREVKVILSGNDHSELKVDDKPVTDTEYAHVHAEDEPEHSH